MHHYFAIFDCTLSLVQRSQIFKFLNLEMSHDKSQSSDKFVADHSFVKVMSQNSDASTHVVCMFVSVSKLCSHLLLRQVLHQ